MNAQPQLMIHPVILSGGAGTRLWPLSRELYPKQLLPLLGKKTLLQETVERIRALNNLSPRLVVVCNEEHRFLVAEQLRNEEQSVLILLEPLVRNTAPALTLATLGIAADHQDALMLVMPADHMIKDIQAFQHAVRCGQSLAEQGYLVTFGIVPTRAETGYGYIQLGKALSHGQTFDLATHEIRSFVEKPDMVMAKKYLDNSEYLWNSGLFMMKVSTWLAEIERLCPEIFEVCQKAYAQGKSDQDFYRVDTEIFKSCPSNSIDYAVMEKITAGGNESSLDKAAVVSLDAGWSDVGVWSTLWEVAEKDASGNVIKGDVYVENTRDCLLYGQQRLLTVIGMKDTIVVETADAVLVVDKNQAENVKKLVTWLKDNNRQEYRSHLKVYRPWGYYESIDIGDRYQVKRITVKQGAALSLQLHHHRAEHWIVVKGTAQVTRGEEVFLLTENESTYIPVGVKHRLENKGSIPLEIIEVQSGGYLGEDDIVRFEDIYGR